MCARCGIKTSHAGETLRAAGDGLRSGETACLRDQSIINILHFKRAEYGYEGPSPVMPLPCRWSAFPTTEWQPHWNSPDGWLPEVVERRRYPGIIALDHVEVYCPDEVDMLSAWAFIPVSEHHQQRLSLYATYEGRKNTRHCSLNSSCCQCGESVAAFHIAGDMKQWPAAEIFLRTSCSQDPGSQCSV